jgi:CubicO group peptidase (beta-lactamase class C family)
VQLRLRNLLLFLGALLIFRFNLKISAAQPTLESAIDRLITTQMASGHIPGLALAVTHDNQVLEIKGYGKAKENQPVTPQTQFLIGSLSKSFTAIAVMQLVEAGEINLDAPLKTYLPEFTLADPTIAAQITVRQLLNQVSGLSDWGFPEWQLSQATTISDRLTNLSRAHPVASPGTQFHYFNPNYELLARLVEVVSQQPFSAYLQAHIFEPLQMSQTLSLITSSEALNRTTNLAQGHLMAFGIPLADAEMSGYLGGSSGVISTAADMANYLILQTNGGQFQNTELLSANSMALMHTPPQSIRSSYGMGWFSTVENGQPAFEHNGILSTFYSEVIVLPKARYGIALLYNISALPLIALALPQIKMGLIQLLTKGPPVARWFSINLWGIAIGLATIIGVGLAIRSLLNLPEWRRGMYSIPLWRLWVDIGGAFFPVIITLTLPWQLALVSDRFFGYALLLRSMPDLIIWLSLCAILGGLNGTARLILLTQRTEC